jgi:hypothetical protein
VVDTNLTTERAISEIVNDPAHHPVSVERIQTLLWLRYEIRYPWELVVSLLESMHDDGDIYMCRGLVTKWHDKPVSDGMGHMVWTSQEYGPVVYPHMPAWRHRERTPA